MERKKKLWRRKWNLLTGDWYFVCVKLWSFGVALYTKKNSDFWFDELIRLFPHQNWLLSVRKYFTKLRLFLSTKRWFFLLRLIHQFLFEATSSIPRLILPLRSVPCNVLIQKQDKIHFLFCSLYTYIGVIIVPSSFSLLWHFSFSFFRYAQCTKIFKWFAFGYEVLLNLVPIEFPRFSIWGLTIDLPKIFMYLSSRSQHIFFVKKVFEFYRKQRNSVDKTGKLSPLYVIVKLFDYPRTHEHTTDKNYVHQILRAEKKNIILEKRNLSASANILICSYNFVKDFNKIHLMLTWQSMMVW